MHYCCARPCTVKEQKPRVEIATLNSILLRLSVNAFSRLTIVFPNVSKIQEVYSEKGSRTLIIDIHAHTSKYPMHKLHVASASIAALESEARRYGISKIVLLATYFPLRGTGVHNLDLYRRIKGNPLFRMFGSLDVMKNLDAGLIELDSLARENKIAGIKLYPGYQIFEPGEIRLNAVYELAKKYRLPVMLHGGELHHCCPSAMRETSARPCGLPACRLREFEDMAHPEYVVKPARDYPTVKFVVSHLANPYFSELRAVMKRCPNVYTDISGQLTSGPPEATEDYRQHIASEITKFLACPDGIDRVMFGTDFPIQGYRDSLDIVRRLRLSPQGADKILAGNALRVLDPDCLPPAVRGSRR